MTKKLFCALARIFWPSARFWDFFGLQKAFGLLQAKKIPKTALGPKNLAAHSGFPYAVLGIMGKILDIKVDLLGCIGVTLKHGMQFQDSYFFLSNWSNFVIWSVR